ncbi:uncharacterized protein [Diadema setosum]|uniref:uncharacterized protein n=1 Tax=Diadema setosum TaxID=31175 RepID=UPI003B3A2078
MEAAEYFAKAYSKKNCKIPAWGNHLVECLESCVSEYLDLNHTQVKDITYPHRLDAFQERLPKCRAKARAKHFLALGLYEIGFEKAKADGEGCLRYLAKCLRELDDAESLYDGFAEKTSLPRLRKAVIVCKEIVTKRMTKSAGETRRTSARASSPPVSASVEKRMFGNDLFKSADHQVGSQKRVRCLKEALELYKKACQLACTDEETVLAAKNVAVTSLKLATLYREHGNHPSGDKGIENHFMDAAKYFALTFWKQKCQCSAWRNRLGKCIENCLQEFQTWISHMTVKVKAAKLEEFLECLPNCHSKAVGKVMLAQYAYNIGLEASQTDDYKECLRYMNRCSLLLDDAEGTCGGEAHVMTNVRTLRKNVECVQKLVAAAAELQRREKQATEEKNRILESLKPKLKKLNSLMASSRSAERCVQQLFHIWPPKSSTVDVNMMNEHSKPSGSAINCLLLAIVCYHPDKVDKAAHGMEWYYFCCEVTKCLNKRLAKYM